MKKRLSPEPVTRKIPVHSLAEAEFPVFVQNIGYKNPYDYTNEHRHAYFEIFFFKAGGGRQLIDFLEIPVVRNSCYIVFPQQVHLLRRGKGSSGLLVQFREEVIPSGQIKSLLRQASFGMNAAVLFENDAARIRQLEKTLRILKEASEDTSSYAHERTAHLLSALLLELLQFRKAPGQENATEGRKLLYAFQSLLEERFQEEHAVQHYASCLNIAERKLSDITRKFLGLTPLQVIHNRILLEARRMILFDTATHKEIAYMLGFDSPASFSQFITNKTGLSPSLLKAKMVKIHK